jgi:RNA polymerase sigma-70 factor, ECF subfamily
MLKLEIPGSRRLDKAQNSTTGAHCADEIASSISRNPTRPSVNTQVSTSMHRADATPQAQNPYAEGTALARRAAAGDRSAQREVFRRLKSPLHSTLYRILGSNAHLEDLLQDTYIEIFRSLASYKGEAQLSTWSNRIAVRVAFRYLRRLRAVKLDSVPPHLSVVGSPEEHMIHREGVRRMYAAMDRMKPEQRIAFALFTLDGRSLKEIADLTGVSLIAAKSRLWRARQQMLAAARTDGILAQYLSAEEG